MPKAKVPTAHYHVEEIDVEEAVRKLLRERGITTELAGFTFHVDHDGRLHTYVQFLPGTEV